MTDSESGHVLGRPRVIRRLWWAFSLVLVLTVLAQPIIGGIKGYFAVDGWFGFGAIYGFLSCLLMVLFAKLLGTVLKRPGDYYAESGPEQEVEGLEESADA